MGSEFVVNLVEVVILSVGLGKMVVELDTRCLRNGGSMLICFRF